MTLQTAAGRKLLDSWGGNLEGATGKALLAIEAQMESVLVERLAAALSHRCELLDPPGDCGDPSSHILYARVLLYGGHEGKVDSHV